MLQSMGSIRVMAQQMSKPCSQIFVSVSIPISPTFLHLPSPSYPCISFSLSVSLFLLSQSLRKASVLLSDLIMCSSLFAYYLPDILTLNLNHLLDLGDFVLPALLCLECLSVGLHGWSPHFGNRLQYPSLPRVLT